MSSQIGIMKVQTVHEVLQNCGCTKYEEFFTGLTLDKVRHYSLQDLWNILPGDEGQLAAGKIMRELERFNSVEVINDQHTPSETTTTKPDEVNGSITSSTGNENADISRQEPFISSTGIDIADDDEDENSIVENDQVNDDFFSDESSVEEESNLIFSSTSNSGQSGRKPVVEISLSDSDEDGEQADNVESQVSSQVEEGSLLDGQAPSSSSRYSLRQRNTTKQSFYSYEDDDDSDDDYFESPTAKKSKPSQEDSEPDVFVKFTPQKFHSVLKRLKRDPDFVDDCINVQIHQTAENDFNDDEHNCSFDDFSDSQLKKWQELFAICGSHINSLEMLTWSWVPLKGKCPYNLFKILAQYCPNLTELSLQRGAASIMDEVKWPEDAKLLNLKVLKITHDGELNYREQLQSILKAATNLKEFKYSFANFSDVNFVLDIFKSLGNSQLKNLKALSIRSFTKSGYLTREQFVALSQLEADELEELELGNGLWEDIEGPIFEQVFHRFPKLKKVIIYGNFQGGAVKKPEILINIPPLNNLEYLDIGGNYEFASVFEDEQTDFHSGARIITIDDDEIKTDLFSVNLNLPLLPNLETIVLGNLFKVDNLHFASLPKLTSFRVGSPWHISVKFPPEESRRNCYPLIKELQLPDCLKDESFVRKIPSRFPNLSKCWIFLPTVCVLRSFFKAMEDSNLKELYLKTQFDFQSTMETCLLDKPTQAIRSQQEYMLEEDLLNYEKFEDFVKFHNIELPAKKRANLEGDEYAGIGALKSLKVLRMEHIGRRLRIPQGNLPFTHYQCQFTNEFLGFKSYPLSKKCLSQLPLNNLISCTWPNFLVNVRDVRNLSEEGFAFCASDDSESDVWGGEASSSSRRRNKGEKLKVQIQPAMLQADLKFHQKEEKK